MNDTTLFLKTLTPNGSLLTWQTFDDDKTRRRKALARILNGTLKAHAETLAKLQAQGAGVFITVNECGGKGRGTEMVVKVRALFVDLDGAPLEPVQNGPLAPHIVVESSPGRWHAYWLVSDCPLEEFEELQKALAARFSGDPSVCDLPRVMRVPGFLHQKGEPFRSRLLRATEGAYTVADFRAAFGFEKKETVAPAPRAPTADLAETLRLLRGALAFLKADADDRNLWLKYAWAIARATDRSQEGFDLLLEWAQGSPKHDPKHDPKHMRAEYFEKSAEPRANPATVATIFQRARAAGWRPRRPCTDLGNAERIADAGEERLKYCPQLESWFLWDGSRWKSDEDGAASRVAKAVARGIYAEAQAEPDDQRRQALARWAVASEGASRLRAAVDLARSDLRLIVNAVELDADPMLLGVRNGVLDLRTGKLLPATPDRYITRQANVAFDPDAKCPTWENVIARTFANNEELIRYLQRATGYMLTGNVMERLFFFAYGESTGTGKSTYTGTLLSLWGDYAVKVKSDVFMRASIATPGRPQPEILAMRGTRLVIATELSDSQKFDEEQLKDFAGGVDSIVARTLHSKKMEAFIPTFKLLLYGNHKPRMRADDEALWVRLHLIPFACAVPLDQQDKTLPTKLLAEYPGILNWCLAGLAAWREAGRLAAPERVAAAGDEYRNEQDVVLQFLDECYIVRNDAWTWGGATYEEYANWCKGHGFHPTNNNKFAAAIKKKGFRHGVVNGRGRFLGLGSIARRAPDGTWEGQSVGRAR